MDKYSAGHLVYAKLGTLYLAAAVCVVSWGSIFRYIGFTILILFIRG